MDAPPDRKIRAQPFFDHVKFLVKDDGERTTFLQWLAHIVQRPEGLASHLVSDDNQDDRCWTKSDGLDHRSRPAATLPPGSLCQSCWMAGSTDGCHKNF